MGPQFSRLPGYTPLLTLVPGRQARTRSQSRVVVSHRMSTAPLSRMPQQTKDQISAIDHTLPLDGCLYSVMTDHDFDSRRATLAVGVAVAVQSQLRAMTVSAKWSTPRCSPAKRPDYVTGSRVPDTLWARVRPKQVSKLCGADGSESSQPQLSHRGAPLHPRGLQASQREADSATAGSLSAESWRLCLSPVYEITRFRGSFGVCDTP